MTLWDLRHSIESSLPWWAPGAAIVAAFGLAGVVRWIIGDRED